MAPPGRDTDRRERWIVVGPVPPPLHGLAFTTPHVLEGLRRIDALADHLDTSDERPVYTTNRLDLLNVWLALRHAVQMVSMLRRHPGARVYVPISQGRWGFLRDALLIAIARAFRRRVTIHLNGGLFAGFYREAPRPEKWLIRRVLAEVEEAWVLTEAHTEIFDGLIDRRRVKILQNTSEDVGLAEARDGRPDEQMRVLFLSNLFPEKGCLDLIEALEQLGERARGIWLRLVGEAHPEVAAEVERRGAALASRGVRVEYAGVRVGSEKFEEYRWADVFTLPSRYPPEGQPLVLLEAMSAGLPIVSTLHSGIPYTVRDGKEGMLVPKGDVAALGEALWALKSNPARRAELGERARARYEEAYTNEAFYAAIAELARGVDAGGAVAVSPGGEQTAPRGQARAS